MDAIVSARVPVESKKRGDSKLREIGSSATELVNAAYDYVIKQGKLPGSVDGAACGEQRLKALSGESAQMFADVWGKRAILETRGYGGNNFKELLNQARSDRYARLA